MPQLGNLITVKKSRRAHACWWCGESIPIGSRYQKWTWYEESDRQLATCKVHPECRGAWNEAAEDEGGPLYVMFGEHERPDGCLSS